MKWIAKGLVFSLTAVAAWAQAGFSGSVGAVLDVTITVESKTEPPQPDDFKGVSGTAFLGKGRPQGMSRYLANSTTHEYTGYDLKLALVKPGQYRATYGPLTLTPGEMNLPDPPQWRAAPVPVFPPAQLVTTADTMVVDLLENPATGQKVVDYIRLKRRNCDGTGDAETSCLTALVQDARRELDDKVKDAEAKQSGAALQALILSQQSWTRYKDDACSGLETEARRANCEVSLTRSRIHDLHSY